MPSRAYVFFDVDDTLLEWTTSWADVFAQVAGEAGVKVSVAQAWHLLRGAFAGVYAECVALHAASGDARAFWEDYDARLLLALGVTEDVPRHAERVIELLSRPDAVRLYPEVPEVLDELKGTGARLGIITSRPVARPDLERFGIYDWFDLVIDAFSARSVKSEGTMFAAAAETAAAEQRAAVHVGDSYADDVIGSRAAGILPILVDRHGRYPDADCLRISDLTPVPGIVANGASRRESTPPNTEPPS